MKRSNALFDVQKINHIMQIQSTLSKTDTFRTSTKCPSYRESNKGSQERQGPTLSVRFTEVSVKRESTVKTLKNTKLQQVMQ